MARPAAVTDELQDAALDSRQIVLFKDADASAALIVPILEDFLLLEAQEVGEVLKELGTQGKALCGLFARDAADLIVEQITTYARKNGLALRCEAVIQKLRP